MRADTLLIPGLLLALATPGCSGDSDRRSSSPSDSAANLIALTDSLVTTLRDSTTVWFVAGRPDTSEAGEVCVERLIELRRGRKRIPVPLLYTMGVPKPINDTTLRAALFRRCTIEAWYRVDTRTGLPKPERES